MKKATKKKAILEQGDDCIDELARKVLSYADHCRKIWDSEKTIPKTDRQFLMRSPVLLFPKHSTRKTLEALEKVIKKRKTDRIDQRSRQYFLELFPYQDFMDFSETNAKYPSLPGHPKNGTVDFNAYRACKIAQDLIRLKRLLKTAPSGWPEQRLLKKEEQYAEQLMRCGPFEKRFYELLLKHKSVVENRWGTSPTAILWADYSFLERDGHTDLLTEEDRFDYDFAWLCDRFALEGITLREPYPIPQRLRILVDRNTLVVRVPNYLSFDWRRDFPGDVVKMLQARGSIITSIQPQTHRAQQEPRWFETISGQDFKKTYYQLVAEQLKTAGGLNMAEIHFTLHQKFINPRTNAYDRASRIRLGRQLLAYHHVPPSEHDPKILELINSSATK